MTGRQIRVLHVANPSLGGSSVPPEIAEVLGPFRRLLDEADDETRGYLDPHGLPSKQAIDSRQLVALADSAAEDVGTLVLVLTGHVAACGDPALEPELRSLHEVVEDRNRRHRSDPDDQPEWRLVVAPHPPLRWRIPHLLERAARVGLDSRSREELERKTADLPELVEEAPVPSEPVKVRHGMPWELRVCPHDGLSLAAGETNVNVWARPRLAIGELREMQDKYKVDLVLHGGRPELAEVDTELLQAGHLYALGAGDPLAISAQLISFSSCHSATVAPLVDPHAGEVRAGQERLLLFERRRPVETSTLATRAEVTYFAPRTNEQIWESVQGPVPNTPTLYYFVGRTLEHITGRGSVLDRLLKRDDVFVRIIATNPRLVADLARVLGKAKGPTASALSSILGAPRQLELDAQNAARSLRRLESFLGRLEPEERSRIDVRISHTLIPFGATVRLVSPKEIEEFGTMVLRLLPNEAISERGRVPHMRLDKRNNEALFQHYLDRIRNLLVRGWPVLGEWAEVDDDLGYEVNAQRLSVEDACKGVAAAADDAPIEAEPEVKVADEPEETAPRAVAADASPLLRRAKERAQAAETQPEPTEEPPRATAPPAAAVAREDDVSPALAPQPVPVGPGWKSGEPADVIVIGTGIAGGVLGWSLVEKGLRVLQLEGGHFIGSHPGNRDRYDGSAENGFGHDATPFADHLRDGSLPVDSKADFKHPLRNLLGGGSVAWGALAVRMQRYEFDGWPAVVRDQVTDDFYDAADRLLGVRGVAFDSDEAFYKRLERSFEFHDPGPAPVAYGAERDPAPDSSRKFCSADLLFDIAQSGRPDARTRRYKLKLRNEAVRLLVDSSGCSIEGVEVRDLDRDEVRVEHARHYVLAAGSVGSPAIVMRSGIADDNDLVGTGVTDHPVLYRPFEIPYDSDLYRYHKFAKCLGIPSDTRGGSHPYNVVLHIGLVDRLRGHVKSGSRYGEVVFLLDAGLADENAVEVTDGRPRLAIGRVPVGEAVRRECDEFAERLISDLGVVTSSELSEAPLMNVVHHVGSLRMGSGDRRVVDEDLRLSGFENLFVCDGSVFPSSPAANPGLTLAALALRLAEHIESI